MFLRAARLAAIAIASVVNGTALGVLSAPTIDGWAKLIAAVASLVGTLGGIYLGVLAHRHGVADGKAAAGAEALYLQLMADEFRRERDEARRDARRARRRSQTSRRTRSS